MHKWSYKIVSLDLQYYYAGITHVVDMLTGSTVLLGDHTIHHTTSAGYIDMHMTCIGFYDCSRGLYFMICAHAAEDFWLSWCLTSAWLTQNVEAYNTISFIIFTVYTYTYLIQCNQLPHEAD